MDRDDAMMGYLQDRLAPEDRARFENSMAQDPSLRAEVDLMRSVRAELAAFDRHEKSDTVWERLETGMASAPRAANENRPAWRQVLQYAAVAVIAVTAWQFIAVPRLGSGPEGFRTASEPLASFVLQVKFVETATIGDIGALLAQAGGTIIDGPGALGLVRVAFVDRAAQQRALDALERRSDLVEFVLDQ